MKNRYAKLIFVFLIFSTLSLFAQTNPIPNPDFENWNGGEPEGWLTGNVPGFMTVTQSGDAQSGAASVRGEVIDLGGLPFGPTLTSGSLQDITFPVSTRHARLTGYYQFSPQGGDSLAVAVDVTNNGLIIGIGVERFGAASSWTPFSIDLNYTGTQQPNAGSIIISIVDPASNMVNVGSFFLVDNLQFEGTAVGIESESFEPVISEFNLSQNYPNPFNPSTTIEFAVPTTEHVQLSIYNSLGQLVESLIDERRAAGRYSVVWNAESLPGGLYFYQLQAGEFSATKKLMLVK